MNRRKLEEIARTIIDSKLYMTLATADETAATMGVARVLRVRGVQGVLLGFVSGSNSLTKSHEASVK